MYGSFVKLMGNPGLFKLTGQTKHLVRQHPQDKTCILVDAGEIISMKDGELIEGTEISANQTVLIKPAAPIVPTKYHAIVSYSPDLVLAGADVTPLSPIVRPGEEDRIALRVRANKKLNLAEIGHVFELYQID